MYKEEYWADYAISRADGRQCGCAAHPQCCSHNWAEYLVLRGCISQPVRAEALCALAALRSVRPARVNWCSRHLCLEKMKVLSRSLRICCHFRSGNPLWHYRFQHLSASGWCRTALYSSSLQQPLAQTCVRLRVKWIDLVRLLKNIQKPLFCLLMSSDAVEASLQICCLLC